MNVLTVLLQAHVDHADSNVCYHVFLYDPSSK